MQNVLRRKLGAAITHVFPEKRLFLRSGDTTRHLRLSSRAQFLACAGGALVMGWTILASSVVLMDGVGMGTRGDLAERDRALYEARLNAISAERDRAIAEAQSAASRFDAALAQVGEMQSHLLAAETRTVELTRGIETAQTGLRSALAARDEAREEAATLVAALDGTGPASDIERMGDAQATIDHLAAALDATAGQRDAMAHEAHEAEIFAERMIHEARLGEERNDRIFTQLEEALSISVSPLDKMFRSAGLDTDNLLSAVKKGYSGRGGPMTPIRFSSKGEAPHADSARANGILERLDRMNLYRIAAERAPFALPVKNAFRFTSGFGPRWGRMHNGTDFAGPHGTPIYSTADGVIIHAGRLSGYGLLVRIQHEFGIETRYAHLSKIRVKVGQRVSRGDRIGDMGNTGRSTGTHLHYEVRVGGKPVNPMTYIKAAQDVF